MEESQTKNKIGRGGEIALGITGGIFGVLAGLFAVFFGGMQTVVDGASEGNVGGNGWSAILFASLAIVAVFFVSSKPKLAGWMLIVSAVGGLISVSLFYVLPFILLIIAGIMSLTRGRVKKTKKAQ